MTENDVMDGLTAVFREVFHRPSLILDPGWTAADLDGWDSLRHVEIILRSEARFGIRLEAAALEGLQSIGDLAALVRKAALAGR
jgi:acyl carrier protein